MITSRKLSSERREEQKKVDSLKIYLEVEREMKCEEILETKIKTFLKLSEQEQSQLLSYQEQNCKDIKQ